LRWNAASPVNDRPASAPEVGAQRQRRILRPLDAAARELRAGVGGLQLVRVEVEGLDRRGADAGAGDRGHLPGAARRERRGAPFEAVSGADREQQPLAQNVALGAERDIELRAVSDQALRAEEGVVERQPPGIALLEQVVAQRGRPDQRHAAVEHRVRTERLLDRARDAGVCDREGGERQAESDGHRSFTRTSAANRQRAVSDPPFCRGGNSSSDRACAPSRS